MNKTSLIHGDCLDYMTQCDDKFFDLAIVDPPYGIGETWKKDRTSKFYKHSLSYKNTSPPGKEYFAELRRVSVNQIIWGANHYTSNLPERNSWIVWDKKKDYPTQHMAEGELAWTSFNIPLRIVELIWNGCCRCEPRHGKHPHEKPIKLYKWLLNQYSTPGEKVLDTHLGSGSSAIAAHYFGCDFTGIEIDEEYFNDAQERFNKYTRQLALF